MARALDYTPTPVAADSADAALRRLLETLHERGVLRLLTNLSAESHEVAQVALEQLDTPKGQTMVANLTVLLGFLSAVDDRALNRLLTGVGRGVEAAAQHRTESDPPGTFRLLRELNDPDVRRGLDALLTILGTLGRQLDSAD